MPMRKTTESRGQGHITGAEIGHSNDAKPSRPESVDGKARPLLPKGHVTCADLSTDVHNADIESQGEGHSAVAHRGQSRTADPLRTDLQGQGHTLRVEVDQGVAAKPLQAKSRGKAKKTVPQGQRCSADTTRPDEGNGAMHAVPQGQKRPAPLPSANGDAGASAIVPQGQLVGAPASPLDKICLEIRQHYRMRYKPAQGQRTRLQNGLRSFLLGQCGWNPNLPKSESSAIKQHVKDLMKYGHCLVNPRLKQPEGIDEAEYHKYAWIIAGTIMASDPFVQVEEEAAREMQALARQLPVHGWWSDIRGVGDMGLAVIVAEAGNLSRYPKIGHLRKRMGITVIDGKRQGNPGSGASKEDWIKHGYNPKRRSAIYAYVCDPVIKQSDVYRAVYLRRKDEEKLRWPDATKMLLHRKAHRYMEQTLLRDLWQEWRRLDQTLSAERSKPGCPAPPHLRLVKAA